MWLMSEQRMIESLGEHGVDPSDLVPALMATHTVKNPEFDPEAKKRAEMERIEEDLDEEVSDTGTEAPPAYQPKHSPAVVPVKTINPFGDDEEPVFSTPSTRPTSVRLPSYDFDEDGGDIGVSSPVERKSVQPDTAQVDMDEGDIGQTLSPRKSAVDPSEAEMDHPGDLKSPTDTTEDTTAEPEVAPALPALPGVSTTLTSADEVVTLDIRWTVVRCGFIPFSG